MEPEYVDGADIVVKLRAWVPPDAKHGRTEIEYVLCEAVEEIEKLRALLRRGLRQIGAWQEKYGAWQPQWLPPSGDVRWAEDVSEALPPNERSSPAAKRSGAA